MIKSTASIITTLFLLGGSFLILSVPTWMAYVTVASMVITLIIHLGYKQREKLALAWNFCAEFCGFCMLVMLFVSTVVMMNQALGA